MCDSEISELSINMHFDLRYASILEIVHNKKKYYKTIDGKEAQSLYIFPVITKMKMNFFKPANDLLVITSSLRLFHSFITLSLK